MSNLITNKKNTPHTVCTQKNGNSIKHKGSTWSACIQCKTTLSNSNTSRINTLAAVVNRCLLAYLKYNSLKRVLWSGQKTTKSLKESDHSLQVHVETISLTLSSPLFLSLPALPPSLCLSVSFFVPLCVSHPPLPLSVSLSLPFSLCLFLSLPPFVCASLSFPR